MIGEFDEGLEAPAVRGARVPHAPRQSYPPSVRSVKCASWPDEVRVGLGPATGPREEFPPACFWPEDEEIDGRVYAEGPGRARRALPLTPGRLTFAQTKVLLALATSRREWSAGELGQMVLAQFPAGQRDAILSGLVAEGRITARAERCTRSRDGVRRIYKLAPRVVGAEGGEP